MKKKIIHGALAGILLLSAGDNYAGSTQSGIFFHLIEIGFGAWLILNTIFIPAQSMTTLDTMINHANRDFDHFLDELYGDDLPSKAYCTALGKDQFVKKLRSRTIGACTIITPLIGISGLACIIHGVKSLKKLRAKSIAAEEEEQIEDVSIMSEPIDPAHWPNDPLLLDCCR